MYLPEHESFCKDNITKNKKSTRGDVMDSNRGSIYNRGGCSVYNKAEELKISRES